MDHYATLGVERTATNEEIKDAFRKRAFADHPDLNNGDQAASDRMAALNRAYSTLSDPEMRKRYDETGLDINDKQMTPEQRARRMVIELISEIVMESGNIVLNAQRHLEKLQEQATKGLVEGDEIIARMESRIKGVRLKPATKKHSKKAAQDNLIVMSIKAALPAIKAKRDAIAQTTKDLDIALAYIKNHESDEIDEPPEKENSLEAMMAAALQGGGRRRR